MSFSAGLRLGVKRPVDGAWGIMNRLLHFPTVFLRKVTEHDVINVSSSSKSVSQGGTAAHIQELHSWRDLHCVIIKSKAMKYTRISTTILQRHRLHKASVRNKIAAQNTSVSV